MAQWLLSLKRQLYMLLLLCHCNHHHRMLPWSERQMRVLLHCCHCATRPHQGLILDASPLIWRDMDQLPHVDDLQRPAPAPQPAAADGSDDAAERASSSSGRAVLQHPVWLALDEVVDPVSLVQPCRCADYLLCIVHIGCIHTDLFSGMRDTWYFSAVQMCFYMVLGHHSCVVSLLRDTVR